MVDHPNTIVLEDGAPAHHHHFQGPTYQVFGVQKTMDWPGKLSIDYCLYGVEY